MFYNIKLLKKQDKRGNGYIYIYPPLGTPLIIITHTRSRTTVYYVIAETLYAAVLRELRAPNAPDVSG